MSRRLLPLLGLFFFLAPVPALGDTLVPAGEIPRLMVEQPGGEAVALPLEHTDVAIEVSGFVAGAKVTQRFGNPFEEPIEAIYVFPLPERAAVDDFRMRIGERVIEGKIEKREEARRIYETARSAGHTAALLEQERPNVFTQSVANLAPGESIEVTLHFVQALPYDAGAFELAFPMVVGPRFMPGSPAGTRSGEGTHADTTEVPDASRISPPVLPAGMRSGHDVSLRVELDAGLPLRDFEVPTHDVEVQAEGDDGLSLQLAAHDHLPNRDFVLRWWVDDAAVQAGLLTHTDARGKFFSLMIQPPQLDVDALVGKRELVFVVDVSGSMSGLPLWQCKKVMGEALSRLRPGDTFNVLTFAGSPGRVWERARPATQGNIELAQAFVDGMSAGGGTMMLDAVAAALEGEVEAGRHRYVFFLTDGYVGNEQQILASARQYVAAHDSEDRKARVFTLGVGSSVNRMLIEGLAKAGKGAARVMTNRESPSEAVDAFYRRIDHPVLTDLSLDWGSLPVRPQSVYPRELPDLFASRPLIVQGRYDGSGRGVITLEARSEDGRKVRMPIRVDLPARDPAHEALPSLWAREKIQALDDSLWNAGRGLEARKLEDVKVAITRLGLDYRILTAYTSFVAVDRSRVVGDGAPTKVVQPVEVPEGVDGQAAGAVAAAPPKLAVRKMARKVPRVHTGRAVVMGAASGPARNTRTSAGKLGKQEAAASQGLLGVLGGTSVGDVHGAGGLGLKGSGKGGGGGASGNTFGVGSVGTRGRGGGLGGYGSGVGGLGGKKDSMIESGTPSVQGSLDKEVIRRVIRSHKNEMRYCYERELQRNPALQGKVTPTFTISPTGKVTAVRTSSTTLKNAAVEGCINARVKTWQFPAPKGGGNVQVSYPFVFQPGGASAPAAPAKPTSTFGAALKIEGGLDRDAVIASLKGQLAGFQRCYEQALTSARPGLAGKVVLSMAIEADGKVGEVKVLSDAMKEPALSACLSGEAARLSFPAAKDGRASQLELPLIFKPAE
ncbi:MAG: AgmX/PglI C-terminal domain-containing protein [Deltaproteobacteria bacterium]|nr:AgmX/PglI C-terminal domain-containing protein [Deltaproteobacteria bacterium]